MSLEEIYGPRRKKTKLDDSDASIDDKTSLRHIQDLERALDINQPKLVVLYLAQKVITTTNLSQKLSMRILKYVSDVRNENRSRDLAWLLRSDNLILCDYPSNRTIFCRPYLIEFLDVVRQLLRHQTIDLKTTEGGELLHRTVAAGDTTLAKLLMQADVDVDIRDPVNNRTLLHSVLRSRNIVSKEKREEFVRLLLDQGAEVNSHCAKGRSVLFTAIVHSHCSFRLIKDLVKRGAVVEEHEGGDMLWTALEDGQHEIAAMLVGSGARLDYVAKSDHRTVLQEVLRSHKIDKREELVRLILERDGVDVNVCDDNDYRALDDAVRHRHCSFRLVEELLEHGARLRKFKSGEHLWAAIEMGNEDMAAKLVRSGIDLSFCKGDDSSTISLDNVQRKQQIRPIFWWMMNRCTKDMAAKLVRSGIDLSFCKGDDSSTISLDNVQRKQQIRPIFWWMMNRCTNLTEIMFRGALPSFEGIQLTAQSNPSLLLKCAGPMTDVTQAVEKNLSLDMAASTLKHVCRGKRPHSLLNLALKREMSDMIKLLLKYGADPHQKDDLGYTPLFQATAFKESEISRLLIERGANIHACNDDGWSPIYGACMHESVKNVHLLLDLGSDMNVVDSNGYSPVDGMNLVKLSDAGRLFIRYFALSVAKGIMVNDKDMASIMNHVRGRSHYEKCTNEIEQMKATSVCNEVPYFTLFKMNTFRIMQQMKNPALVSNFKQNNEKLPKLFPLYHKMLLHSLNIVKIRHKLFRKECVYIQNSFEGLLPDLVVEKVAHFLTLEKVKQYQQNYYLALHQNLYNTKAD